MKEGDKVRPIEDHPHVHITKRQVGTVESVDYYGVEVRFKNREWTVVFAESDLKLVAKKKELITTISSMSSANLLQIYDM